MAFRTNKVPAIEERSVRGSSVSFNSAFALPLKACKVSFSATQSGSGDPSPSNPRAISGVSAITFGANGSATVIDLDGTRYGGYVDFIEKEIVITDMLINVSDFTSGWLIQTSGTKNRFYNSFPDTLNGSVIISNMFKQLNTWQENTVTWGAYNNIIFTADFSYTLQDWLDFLSNNTVYVVCGMKTPIRISLTDLPNLSSIIGNNTFSTDTGTLEITFADLQEKSASGSVATFNTALAMPLASCNIAVNAWQEGRGEPSPSNVRPIHGWDKVNATRAGKNLYNGVRTFANPSNTSSQAVNRTFTPNSYCLTLTFNNYMAATLPPTYISDVVVNSNSISYYNSSTGGTAYITLACPVLNLKWGETYIVSGTRTNCNLYVSFYKQDGTYIRYEEPNIRFTVPNETYYTCLIFRASGQGTVSYSNIQLEAGSTATPYEPYVTPTIYPIQLGQEVYGAEVDVDNGVAHVTHEFITFDGSSDENWYVVGMVGTSRSYNLILENNYTNRDSAITNYLKYSSTNRAVWGNFALSSNNIFHICDRDDTFEDVNSFKAYLSNNPLTLLYELAEPFDIQLSDIPTLSTNIGNNTIFADTGDVDLTYKDLDIAKRGNFREVFRLPS